MTNLTDTYSLLLANEATETECDEPGWIVVRLDDARMLCGLRPRQFSAHLSALARAGMYQKDDGKYWALVKIADAA